jgi:integrase
VAKSRAANGEGSIYQDASGTWHGLITVGSKRDAEGHIVHRRDRDTGEVVLDEKGRPIASLDRRHVRGRTRAEVKRSLSELRDQAEKGRLPRAGRAVTVAEWLDFWLQQVVRPTLKPNTYEAYRVDVERHLKPTLGPVRLDRLTVHDVEGVLNALVASGRSGTAQHVRRTLRASLNRAVKHGRMAANPVQLTDPPPHTVPEMRALTLAEARQVIGAAEQSRNGAAFVLALSLGLRRGEVLGLQWSDVDLTDGTLTVRRALSRVPYRHGCGDTCGHKRGAECPERMPGGLVFDAPKTRAGRRTLPIPPQAVEALIRHLSAQEAERSRALDLWADDDLVFATEAGQPVDPMRLTREWNALLLSAGVQKARLHDARHSAATMQLALGVDTTTVMATFGWSQRSMLDRYAHPVEELKRAAAARVGAALFDSTDATALGGL